MHATHDVLIYIYIDIYDQHYWFYIYYSFFWYLQHFSIPATAIIPATAEVLFQVVIRPPIRTFWHSRAFQAFLDSRIGSQKDMI